MIKHANKWLVTSNCHFNAVFHPPRASSGMQRTGWNVALKWRLEVTSHLLACLIVQDNHPTINSSMPNNFLARGTVLLGFDVQTGYLHLVLGNWLLFSGDHPAGNILVFIYIYASTEIWMFPPYRFHLTVISQNNSSQSQWDRCRSQVLGILTPIQGSSLVVMITKLWLGSNIWYLTPTSVSLWSTRVVSREYSTICLATQIPSIGCPYYSDNQLPVTKCKHLVWAPEPNSTVALPLSPQTGS